MRILEDIGLPYVMPYGSYFALLNCERLKVPLERVPEHIRCKTKDWITSYWMTTDIGVAAIPYTAFFAPEHAELGQYFVRLCFCKTDETLDAAAERLQRLKAFI